MNSLSLCEVSIQPSASEFTVMSRRPSSLASVRVSDSTAPRAHAADVPYAVAVVRLKEGVSILGRIVDVPLDKLAVGLPVRFRPLIAKDLTASVGFGPA